MGFPSRKAKGYSMVELLMVLVIVGVLAVVGVSMLGNRKAASVRDLLDELEGSLANARQLAVATGRDVQVCNWGTWSGSWGTNDPFRLAYGDSSLTLAQVQSTGRGLLNSTAANAAIPYSWTVAVPFFVLPTSPTGDFLPRDVNQSRARIVMAGSHDWAVAGSATSTGATNVAITGLPPFSTIWGTNPTLVSDTNNPFNGTLQQVSVFSARSQTFISTFIIEVVGTSPSAGPVPGSAMCLIVVLANSGEIYKFYNPGVLEGNGQWRRI
jgi:prepilin-type N-terminal cleavage/methylation domain-containing protein